MNENNAFSPKTNRKFFIIGFIGALLLNVVAIFIYLMTVFSSSWGGGITIVGGILMMLSVLMLLAVSCVSIYLVRSKKDISLKLRSCAKGSMYCTLPILAVMLVYSLYIVISLLSQL